MAGKGAVDVSARPAAAAAAGADLPVQRRVPPEVLAILRAEAETERRARLRAADGAADGATGGGDADPPDRNGEDDTTEATAPTVGRSPVQGPATQAGDLHGDAVDDGKPPGEDRETAPPQGRSHTPVDGLGARDRLARLTAAERQPATSGSGTAERMGTRDGEEDHGLVEDPGAARRDPRPPLLHDLPAAPEDGPGLSRDGHLPVAVAAGAQHALVVLQAKRRGFQLGFGATFGACCAALGLYVLALNGGDIGGDRVLDTVRSHGAQVQAALVDWLRRVVAPALS